MGTCANSGLFSAEADNILPGKISATTIELLTRAMMMVMTQMMMTMMMLMMMRAPDLC